MELDENLYRDIGWDRPLQHLNPTPLNVGKKLVNEDGHYIKLLSL